MVKRFNYPPELAWNFVSFGLCVFLIGSGWSVARAKVYQLEVAEYKLQVGTALSQVQEVSNTLEKVSNSTAIAPQDKRKIQQLTEKSNAVLEQVGQEIDRETEKLFNENIEE